MTKNMKNKILGTMFALLLIGIIALVGVTYAYKGDPNVKGPNYSADVHEQMEEAMSNKDYDAWIKIRQDNNLPMNGRMFQVINKDNFNKYVEMYNANLAGDIVKADAIKAELGVGNGMMGKSGMQKGTGNGMCQGSGVCKRN